MKRPLWPPQRWGRRQNLGAKACEEATAIEKAAGKATAKAAIKADTDVLSGVNVETATESNLVVTILKRSPDIR